MALALASVPGMAFAPAPVVQRASVVMESAADVEALAKKLNPGAPPIFSRAASGNKNN